MFFFLLLLFTTTSVRTQWASNIEPSNNPSEFLEKEIIFNEQSKILLTKKFVRVESLVSLPTYYFSMKPDLEQLN